MARISGRKLAIMSVASELSLLCNADIGVAMFNENGRLILYAGNGSTDNMLVSYGGQPEQCRPLEDLDSEQLDEYEDHLKRFKAMAEGLASIEDLEKRVQLLQQYCRMVTRKLSNYEPHPMNINTLEKAQHYERFLLMALRRVRNMMDYIPHDKRKVEKQGNKRQRVDVKLGYSRPSLSRLVRKNPKKPNNAIGRDVLPAIKPTNYYSELVIMVAPNNFHELQGLGPKGVQLVPGSPIDEMPSNVDEEDLVRE